jgi:hypothetical protein
MSTKSITLAILLLALIGINDELWATGFDILNDGSELTMLLSEGATGTAYTGRGSVGDCLGCIVTNNFGTFSGIKGSLDFDEKNLADSYLRFEIKGVNFQSQVNSSESYSEYIKNLTISFESKNIKEKSKNEKFTEFIVSGTIKVVYGNKNIKIGDEDENEITTMVAFHRTEIPLRVYLEKNNKVRATGNISRICIAAYDMDDRIHAENLKDCVAMLYLSFDLNLAGKI